MLSWHNERLSGLKYSVFHCAIKVVMLPILNVFVVDNFHLPKC